MSNFFLIFFLELTKAEFLTNSSEGFKVLFTCRKECCNYGDKLYSSMGLSPVQLLALFMNSDK